MLVQDEAATSKIFKTKGLVVKIINEDLPVAKWLFDNEVKFLSKLQDLNFVPGLYCADYPVLCLENCGEPISKENAPKYFKTRMQAYINILHDRDCYHNDIKPDNILVDQGKVKIIDFGWSTETEERPGWFPDVLGGDFKGDDDFESFEKVLEWLKN